MTASISHRDFPLSVKLAKRANQYLSDALSQKYGYSLKGEIGELFEKKLLIIGKDDARKALLNKLSNVCNDEQHALKVLAHIVGKNEDEIIEKRNWRNRLKSFYKNVLEPLLIATDFFLSIMTIILKLLGLFYSI